MPWNARGVYGALRDNRKRKESQKEEEEKNEITNESDIKNAQWRDYLNNPDSYGEFRYATLELLLAC